VGVLGSFVSDAGVDRLDTSAAVAQRLLNPTPLSLTHPLHTHDAHSKRGARRGWTRGRLVSVLVAVVAFDV
jgi:hypothetical protein